MNCPDGGTCHHACEGACWRVRTCSPLSGVYHEDSWPLEVVAEHGAGDGIPRVEDLLVAEGPSDLDLLREALRFYADEGNYVPAGIAPTIWTDNGARARAALHGIA